MDKLLKIKRIIEELFAADYFPYDCEQFRIALKLINELIQESEATNG